VLIPYPHAAEDHQLRNAEVYAIAGAAKIVDERRISARLDDALAATTGELLTNCSARRAMSSAMRQLARPDAAWQVAMLVCDLARQAVERNVA
jgi:UDP-N-acetylglucosamine--N-acetylmuramyl-(pentapeptide) pyrophosphoryl-undecaprenol N-acetylglucosamine transferase